MHKCLHNSGFWGQMKKQLLTMNGLILGNGKQSVVKAASLIPLQFIHNQYSTLPKLDSVFCLITATTSVSIAQGQYLPKVHIPSLRRGDKRNNCTPSNTTAAKTITVWDFFPAPTVNKTSRIAACQGTSCCCTHLSK